MARPWEAGGRPPLIEPPIEPRPFKATLNCSTWVGALPSRSPHGHDHGGSTQGKAEAVAEGPSVCCRGAASEGEVA